MADKPFRVFISWSKSPSKEIALELKAWLPKMFDGILPWMSDKDIKLGTRSYQTIATALSQADLGLILTTQSNQFESWLTYEAGALSNTFKSDQTRVVPILVDFPSKSDLQGPIKQYENCTIQRDGIEELCQLISTLKGLDWEVSVKHRFQLLWPELQTAFDAVLTKFNKDQQPVPVVSTEPPTKEMIALEELVENVRELMRRTEESQSIFSQQLLELFQGNGPAARLPSVPPWVRTVQQPIIRLGRARGWTATYDPDISDDDAHEVEERLEELRDHEAHEAQLQDERDLEEVRERQAAAEEFEERRRREEDAEVMKQNGATR